MASDTVCYVGTIGQGIMRSTEGGQTFARACNGIFVESDVRALAVHPHDPAILYAGTNVGIYRTRNGGDHWERLDTPFDNQGWPSGTAVWSLQIHPRRPETLFAGICPPALYRSTDGGDSWQPLRAEILPECDGIRYPRVTCLVVDPMEEEVVWAGVEIDGVRRSADGGETWQRLGDGLSSLDIHGLAVVPGTPKTLLAATNNDLNVSTDEGRTWQPQHIKARFPYGYCRGIAQRADDPRTVFLGIGNGPPGTAGALLISRDGGGSWQQADLSDAPNSTIWTFATTAQDPDRIACASVSGYLYLSRDSGQTWQKSSREFGEIRSLALTL